MKKILFVCSLLFVFILCSCSSQKIITNSGEEIKTNAIYQLDSAAQKERIAFGTDGYYYVSEYNSSTKEYSYIKTDYKYYKNNGYIVLDADGYYAMIVYSFDNDKRIVIDSIQTRKTYTLVE